MKARELSSESAVYFSSVASICVNKSGLMHHYFQIPYKTEAKILRIQALPSCAGDVTWSLCSRDWEVESPVS